jgi:hypothetical protein
MQSLSDIMRGIIAARGGKTPMASPRRSRKAALSWDCLEERTVLSHFGFPQGLGSGFFFGTGGSGRTQGSTQNTQLTTAITKLKSDIQTIQSKSTETVAQIVALHSDFHTLEQAGLFPNRQLYQTFENDLLTAVAASRTAGNNGTLTSAQTSTLQAELESAFGPSASNNAQVGQLFKDDLAIVQASEIDSADLATIAKDQANIKAALGTTSTGSPTSHGAGYAGRIASATAASLLIPGYY